MMKGWRTVAFNSLMALFALLASLGIIEGDQTPDATAIDALLNNLEAIILFATPLVNLVLRWVTTGPVGTKA